MRAISFSKKTKIGAHTNTSKPKAIISVSNVFHHTKRFVTSINNLKKQNTKFSLGISLHNILSDVRFTTTTSAPKFLVKPAAIRNYSQENQEKQNEAAMKPIQNSDTEQEEDNPEEVATIKNYRIHPSTIQKLKDRKITSFTPIQYETYDLIYDGRDVIGRARTGTGKTLAFILPAVEAMRNKNMTPGPKILVMEPTRELAKQTAAEFEQSANFLKTTCIYGGVGYGDQARDIKNGAQVIVGTPGRIIDFIHQGKLKLSELKYIVLDEADEMLKIGFQKDIEEILNECPPKTDRQMVLFSATIPTWVKELSQNYLKPKADVVDLIGDETVKASELITHLCIQCNTETLMESLVDVVRLYSNGGNVLIFAPTKDMAQDIAGSSSISSICEAIHGDVSQGRREGILEDFRNSKFSVLVATDVAARGLDIPSIDLVIQVEAPRQFESYIHRVGRTGRAGRAGTAITFHSFNDSYKMKQIEDFVGIKFKRIGVPHSNSMLAMSAQNALKTISEVSNDVLPHFTEVAKKIIAERGDVNAVAAAIAAMTGHKSLSHRSLFGKKDYQTILVDGEPSNVKDLFPSATNINYLAHPKKGIVVDINSMDLAKMKRPDFLNSVKRFGVQSVKVLEELPELHVSVRRDSDRGRGDRGRFGDRGRDDRRFGDRSTSGGFGDRRRSAFSDDRRDDRRFGDRKFDDRRSDDRRSFGSVIEGYTRDSRSSNDRRFGDRKFDDRRSDDRKFSDRKFDGGKFDDRKFGEERGSAPPQIREIKLDTDYGKNIIDLFGPEKPKAQMNK